MTDYDNRGQVSLWKPDSDNPKAPAYRGVVVAHRDIREGEELELALWPNRSDNPKAPKVTGKLSDKYQPEQRQETSAPAAADDEFDDEIPF